MLYMDFYVEQPYHVYVNPCENKVSFSLSIWKHVSQMAHPVCGAVKDPITRYDLPV